MENLNFELYCCSFSLMPKIKPENDLSPWFNCPFDCLGQRGDKRRFLSAQNKFLDKNVKESF